MTHFMIDYQSVLFHKLLKIPVLSNIVELQLFGFQLSELPINRISEIKPIGLYST